MDSMSNSFEDLAKAANECSISLSYLNAVLAEWNKIMDIPDMASDHGRWMIASRRRYIRHQAKRRGRWVERKLHYFKNSRDNLYYEWRNWWEA